MKKSFDKTKYNIYLFFEWISKLVILNFCFILGVIIGLGFLGLGPALHATQYYLKKTLEKDELKVFPTFWQVYTKHFGRAFLISILYLIILSILTFSFIVCVKIPTIFPSDILRYLSLATSSILFIYFFMGLNFVYYFINEYRIPNGTAIKYSLSLPWGRFGYMSAIIALNIILFTLTGLLDLIMLILDFSVSGLIFAYFAKKIFPLHVCHQIQQFLNYKQKEEEKIIQELQAEDMAKRKKRGKDH